MDMNTLAVLLAGEFRTWEKCASYMFKFFEGQAERIDYFFATWTESSDLPNKQITQDLVKEKFIEHDKNLVAQVVIPPIGRKNSTFYNQAYLAKFANVLKRENEIRNNFIYDQVVETRPDIYIRRNVSKWIAMKDYEFCNCNHITKSSQNFDSIDDVYYRTNSFTNDIMANRYWHRKPYNSYVQMPLSDKIYLQSWHNHHCMIMEYCNLNNIRFNQNSADILGVHIAVRQSAIDVDFDVGDIFELKEKYQPHEQHSWQKTNTTRVIWH